MPLPINIDSTYEDDAQDPSVQEHQEHHDALHSFYNDWEGVTPGSGGGSGGEVLINVKDDHGATGDGSTDDTAAIQAALDAAHSAGGGVVYLPPGTYMVSAPLVMYSHTHLRGSEHSSRYWGYATTSPTHLTMIRVMPSFSGTAVIMPSAGEETKAYGYSISSLMIYGARIGSVSGVYFPQDVNNQHAKIRDLSISSMGGNGLDGHAMVADISHFYIGGCLGWGITTDTNWTDCHISHGFISSNVLGGLNFDGTSNSGYCIFTDVRIERSGWNPGDVNNPSSVGSPGIRLRRCNHLSFANCSTDANSGNGLDIEPQVDNGSLHTLQFSNCHFRRDGYGDMSTQADYAGVRIGGASGRVPTYVAFSNCTVGIGKAVDGGAAPAYNHPRFGLWWTIGSHNEWIGGRVDGANQAVNVTGSYRPILLIPNSGIMTSPVGSTSGRPANPLQGYMYYDTSLSKPIWWSGSTWRDAAGTSV